MKEINVPRDKKQKQPKKSWRNGQSSFLLTLKKNEFWRQSKNSLVPPLYPLQNWLLIQKVNSNNQVLLLHFKPGFEIFESNSNLQLLRIQLQTPSKLCIKGPGLPCKLIPLPGRCPICDASHLIKIAWIKITDPTPLQLGVWWQVDFIYIIQHSVDSWIFSSTLIIECTSWHLWYLPSWSKMATLDILLHFFNCMQRQGFPCIWSDQIKTVLLSTMQIFAK
jgi:hypothetical protein